MNIVQRDHETAKVIKCLKLLYELENSLTRKDEFLI